MAVGRVARLGARNCKSPSTAWTNNQSRQRGCCRKGNLENEDAAETSAGGFVGNCFSRAESPGRIGAPAAETVDVSLAGMQKLEWQPRAPGVSSATIGKAELGPMAFAGSPRIEALKELGEPILPPAMNAARGDVHGVYASVRIPLAADEKVYGLGMRDDGLVDLRSRSFELKVTWSTHAPVPFYISSPATG